MRHIGSALAVFLLLSMLFTLPQIPKAHATGSVVGVVSCAVNTSANCIVSYTIVNTGDLLLLAAGFEVSAATLTVTDTFSQFTQNTPLLDLTCSGVNHYDTQIFWGTTTSTGSDSITLHATAVESKLDWQVIEVSGVGQIEDTTGTGVGDCSTNVQPNTSSTAFSAGDFLFAADMTSGTGGTQAPGTGFTCTFNITPLCNNAALQGIEWAFSGISSPTTFPFSGVTISHWSEIGLSFGTSPTTVVLTSVVACTWFQLSCWIFPIMIFGLYAGFFVSVGAAAKASPKGMTYLFLAALSTSAMGQIILGTLSFQIAILFILGAMIFAVRMRGTA